MFLNKYHGILILIWFFALSSTVTISVAQHSGVGVEVGDHFVYDLAYSYESNDPDFAPFFTPHQNDKVDAANITILNISGSNMTVVNYHVSLLINEVWYNGLDLSLDIETGKSDADMYQVMLWPWGCIPANFTEDDIVFKQFRINQTFIKKFAYEEREINYVQIFDEKINMTYKFFWDRASGVLVEFSWHHLDQIGEYMTEELWAGQLISTDLWVVTEFSSLIILPLFMIATLLAAIIYKRKRL